LVNAEFATASEMLTWEAAGGFSLDACIRIHGADSAGRERLLSYCARPSLSSACASTRRASDPATAARLGDDAVRRVLYQPAPPTPDGRTILALSPLEFLAALARLIPPARACYLQTPVTTLAPPHPPTYDLTEPEPIPDFDFDQSAGA
jgi:hypothetical protein